MKQEPKSDNQINELKTIGQMAKSLQNKAKKHKTEPTKKLNQIPGFNDNYNALTSYIQSYAQRYKTKDIEQFLQQSSTLTKKEELKQIINKAIHIPPSRYSHAKHWRGNSEEERRQNSANRGAGQFLYSMTPEQVKQLEKETLLTGQVIDKGGDTYHAYKQFSNPIGYADEQEAYWLRAELTGANSGSPSIHSHPRLSK